MIKWKNIQKDPKKWDCQVRRLFTHWGHQIDLTAARPENTVTEGDLIKFTRPTQYHRSQQEDHFDASKHLGKWCRIWERKGMLNEICAELNNKKRQTEYDTQLAQEEEKLDDMVDDPAVLRV